jgi:hypothetical protein
LELSETIRHGGRKETKRKCLTIGIILLFFCVAFMPIITADSTVNNNTITSPTSSTLENPKEFKTRIFAIWRIRGEIRDLTIGDNSFHFNTTRVIETAIGVLFLLPFISIPILKRMISINEEWWVIWDGPFIFHKEKITENHIDLFAILWGEWYSPELTVEIRY